MKFCKLIIAHPANTASGFSGTLMQKVTCDASGNITARGDYTLSFRSTEFADDNEGGGWPRDGVAGADGEMAAYGFALAQIADMKASFREPRGDRPKADGTYGTLLPGSVNYNVTGYSLGGHLATAFNILQREEQQAGLLENGIPIFSTTTFNGAGVGDCRPERR